MRTLLTLVLTSTILLSTAQEVDRLSYKEYMRIVATEHPMTISASLAPLEAEAMLRMARGGFDPVIGAELSQKYFDDKEYYRLIDAGLEIPTWYGLKVRGGYEQNQGQFLNPEANTPDNGLLHGGLGLTLGQGLFIDKRRAQLQKAEIAQDLNQLQQRLMMNELLLEAGMAYWEWFQRSLNVEVFEEALEAAEIRFEAVKASARLGDVPSIDTLEAGIQYQNRLLSLQQAQLEEKNARAKVSAYLWLSGLVPMQLGADTYPQDLGNTEVSRPPDDMRIRLDEMVASHPMLEAGSLKLDQLDIERRWAAEQLKPTIDLKYNFLSERTGSTESNGFNTEDYAWGVDLRFPLFLREQRGNLQLAELAIRDNQLGLADKQQVLKAKTEQAVNTWETTEQQFRLYARTVSDYAGLLAGERELFSAGESSLFLVNRRELGFIDTQLKVNELLSKNRMSELKIYHALGVLDQRISALTE